MPPVCPAAPAAEFGFAAAAPCALGAGAPAGVDAIGADDATGAGETGAGECVRARGNALFGANFRVETAVAGRAIAGCRVGATGGGAGAAGTDTAGGKDSTASGAGTRTGGAATSGALATSSAAGAWPRGGACAGTLVAIHAPVVTVASQATATPNQPRPRPRGAPRRSARTHDGHRDLEVGEPGSLGVPSRLRPGGLRGSEGAAVAGLAPSRAAPPERTPRRKGPRRRRGPSSVLRAGA